MQPKAQHNLAGPVGGFILQQLVPAIANGVHHARDIIAQRRSLHVQGNVGANMIDSTGHARLLPVISASGPRLRNGARAILRRLWPRFRLLRRLRLALAFAFPRFVGRTGRRQVAGSVRRLGSWRGALRRGFGVLGRFEVFGLTAVKIGHLREHFDFAIGRDGVLGSLKQRFLGRFRRGQGGIHFDEGQLRLRRKLAGGLDQRRRHHGLGHQLHPTGHGKVLPPSLGLPRAPQRIDQHVQKEGNNQRPENELLSGTCFVGCRHRHGIKMA